MRLRPLFIRATSTVEIICFRWLMKVSITQLAAFICSSDWWLTARSSRRAVEGLAESGASLAHHSPEVQNSGMTAISDVWTPFPTRLRKSRWGWTGKWTSVIVSAFPEADRKQSCSQWRPSSTTHLHKEPKEKKNDSLNCHPTKLHNLWSLHVFRVVLFFCALKKSMQSGSSELA